MPKLHGTSITCVFANHSTFIYLFIHSFSCFLLASSEEEQQKEAFDLASGEEFDDTSLVAEDDKELGKVKEYLLAVEKLEMSMRFLDAHFGGVGSPRGLRER